MTESEITNFIIQRQGDRGILDNHFLNAIEYSFSSCQLENITFTELEKEIAIDFSLGNISPKEMTEWCKSGNVQENYITKFRGV